MPSMRSLLVELSEEFGPLRMCRATIVQEWATGTAGWMHTPKALDVIRDVWRSAAPLKVWLDTHVSVLP
ncbi:hypothetical protein [Nesterenkonia muleiensis]|uniref:hypothetical protein n=1 Tax=Nesterenkonia muleiensis TaxID=2282648 RepID=UPI00192E3A7A|nr:hypothetical protein [Nesterenkonia muleiensis]